MLTCREVSQQASEYLDGNLPWHRRVGLRVHLFMCRHCRAFIHNMEQTRRVLNAQKPIDPDEELLNRFQLSVQEELNKKQP